MAFTGAHHPRGPRGLTLKEIALTILKGTEKRLHEGQLPQLLPKGSFLPAKRVLRKEQPLLVPQPGDLTKSFLGMGPRGPPNLLVLSEAQGSSRKAPMTSLKDTPRLGAPPAPSQ